MEKDKGQKSPLKRRFSAGGAVFRKVREGDLEWLIIKPVGYERWQLPKGTIEKGEKSQKTAEREVFEETGVKAQALEKVFTSRYFFIQDGQKIFKTVVFYLMKSDGGETDVKTQWAHEIDQATWVSSGEALEKLTYKDDREVIKKAEEIFNNRE